MTHIKRLTGLGLTASLASVSLFLAVPRAMADQPFQIEHTDIGIYQRSTPSMASEKVGEALPNGATITATCETEGEPVDNATTSVSTWARTAEGTYLPLAFSSVGTSGGTLGLPKCEQDQSAGDKPADEPDQVYDGDKAADYARKHYEDEWEFNHNCTAFASKVLWAGGLPKSEKWTNKSNSWKDRLRYKRFTDHARITDKLVEHLTKNDMAEEKQIAADDNSAGGARPGDIIAYDWGPSQKYEHLAVVTGTSPDGRILVTQQTSNQIDRVWNELSNPVQFKAALVKITH